MKTYVVWSNGMDPESGILVVADSSFAARKAVSATKDWPLWLLMARTFA